MKTVHSILSVCMSKGILFMVFFTSSTFLYSHETTSQGDSASLGDGIVKGWVITDHMNNPQRIGLTMTGGCS